MEKLAFEYPSEFLLQSGDRLPGFTLAYQTWGSRNEERNNVIWVCHALTGDSNVAGWWPGIWGPGAFLDPDKYFIVCANVLGSCYGSTYALSPRGNEGSTNWWYDFPLITVADMARAHDHLRQHLGITEIHASIGGSLGGQQVLEWAIQRPEVFSHIIPIATNAFHSPWGIAFNESQRMAIEADPTWGTLDFDAGKTGMKAARAMALLSYRAYSAYGQTQKEPDLKTLDAFRASSYQQYQGKKLADRFDAFAYWYLSKAMDSHQVGRNFESTEAALGLIKAKATVIGISSDLLAPTFPFFPINTPSQ